MLVDASPLIYIAKLDALDVFRGAGQTPLITVEVERETARPGLAYIYPDALLIAEAIRDGVLTRTELTDDEQRAAKRLSTEAGGLDLGEADVIAAAAGRSQPVLLFERRAARLARSMGLETWDPVQLLVAGTPDRERLVERVTAFARLVNMRFEDLEEIVRRIEGQR